MQEFEVRLSRRCLSVCWGLGEYVGLETRPGLIGSLTRSEEQGAERLTGANEIPPSMSPPPAPHPTICARS